MFRKILCVAFAGLLLGIGCFAAAIVSFAHGAPGIAALWLVTLAAVETVAFTMCYRMERARLALITSRSEAEVDEILLKMAAIRMR